MSSARTLAPHVARILLGLVFFVFGLNGFLGFLPLPAMPDPAASLMGALGASGYFFPLLKGVEVLAGLALLSNRFVPLALVVLAPVVVQIAAFHIALTPGQIGMSIVLLALEGFLAYTYRDAYRAVLTARATPALGAPRAAASSLAPAGA